MHERAVPGLFPVTPQRLGEGLLLQKKRQGGTGSYCLPYIETGMAHKQLVEKYTRGEHNQAMATALNFFLEVREHSSTMLFQRELKQIYD